MKSACRLVCSCWLALVSGLCISAVPPRAALDLGTFQAPDGAITVTEGGMIVEPYFALKALLIAHDYGINVSAATERYMHWMDANTGAGGISQWPRFQRSCRKDPGADWTPCAKADADDALLALWMTALAENPSFHSTHANLSASEQSLAELYMPQLSVYQIDRETPVALLMDNAEIANSMSVRARLAQLHHDKRSAEQLERQRSVLLGALPTAFAVDAGLPAASTQVSVEKKFYPDQVLPAFLEAEGIPAANWSPSLMPYKDWMARYREAWLSGDADVFPWGLVALVADQHHDEPTVACWLQRAQTLRHGSHWNVMEEAVWQALLTHRTFPREALTC